MPEELIKQQSMTYVKFEKEVVFTEELEEETKSNGIKEIWNLIDPIWKYSREQLVKYMLQRIIYQTGIFEMGILNL